MAGLTPLNPETPHQQNKQTAPTGSRESDPAHRTVDYREVLELRKKNAQLEIELARQHEAHEGTSKGATPSPHIPSEADTAWLKSYADYVTKMSQANEILISVGQPALPINPPPIIEGIPANPLDAATPTKAVHIGERSRAQRHEQGGESISSSLQGERTKTRVSAHERLGNRKRSPTPPRVENKKARGDVRRRLGPQSENPRDTILRRRAQTQTEKPESDDDEAHSKDTHRTKTDRKYEDLRQMVLELRNSKREEDKEPSAAIDALSDSLISALPQRQVSNVSLTDYSGTSDPYEWLAAFESKMMLATRYSAAWCVAMVGCMKGKAST